MNTKLLFVTFVALALLGLYIFSLKLEMEVAKNCKNETVKEEKAKVGDAEKPKPVDPADPCLQARKSSGNIGFILSTVGGLVAAFAIAALAVTKPGETPNKGLTDAGIKGLPELIAKIIPLAFVATWFISGLFAIIYSFFMENIGSAALNELGKGWVGTALAGVGAWFGVNPQNANPSENNNPSAGNG